jgi:ELWxxDGT repeat protein
MRKLVLLLLWATALPLVADAPYPVNIAGVSGPEHLLAHGGLLYFIADDAEGPALWRTDGTLGGTVAVMHAGAFDGLPVPLVSFNGTLYLTGVRGELRKLDEMSGTDVVVTDQLVVIDAVVAGGRLFLIAEDADHGQQLWTTDGTAAGTVRITNADLLGERPGLPLSLAGREYFLTEEGRLYETDGTPEGARLLDDSNSPPFYERTLLSFGPSLYSFGSGVLRKWSGSPADKTDIAVSGGSSLGAAVIRDGILFFAREANEPLQLRISDGSAEGTKLVREFAGSSSVEELIAADGRVYFAASDELHGRELWQTDGTPAGTALVADIRAGPLSSSPAELTRVGDTLYFAARGESGRVLWAYDLPRGVTASIDDGRASENTGSIAVTVRLNRASSQSVAVQYATADDTAKAGQDYTAASGTITFAPGETVQTVTIPIAANSAPGGTRGFFVRLSSGDVAVDRGVAGGIIEDDDISVDLLLSLVPYGAGARLRVGNAGTSAASNAVLCVATPPDANAFTCTQPFVLKPGETFTRDVPSFGNGSIVAKVTPWESDSNPVDNASTWAVANVYPHALYVHPAVPRIGEQVTVTVTTARINTEPEVIWIISSDRHVITLPQAVTIPAGADSITIEAPALQSGVTILAIDRPSQAYGVTVFVYGSTQPLKATPILNWDDRHGEWRFGVHELTLHVDGLTIGGAKPTGTVEFSDNYFGGPLGTAPLRDGKATIRITPGLGPHQFSVRYSGDANFTAHAHFAFLEITVVPGETLIRVERLPETFDLLVTVTGVDGHAPTGPIGIEDADHPEHRRTGLLTPIDAARSTFRVTNLADAKTIYFNYGGDQYYARKSGYIDFNRSARGRAVRH